MCWRFLLTFTFLFISIFSIPSTLAYSDMSIEITPTSLSICPCSTLTANDVRVFVTNKGTFTDTYSLTLELPEDWSGFPVQPYTIEITLASGEKGKIETLYITPSCWVEPKNYSIAITVKSKSSGKTVTRELSLEILKCHWITIELENVTTCKGVSVSSQINLTNQGKFNETINLSASVKWVTFSDNLLSLEPKDNKSVNLIFHPPVNLIGLQNISIRAESTTSYVQTEKLVWLEIQTCYSASVDITPINQSACPCSSANYSLMLRNTGLLADNYSIEFGNITEELELKPNQSQQISLTLLIPCNESAGVYPITLTVTSHDFFESNVTLNVLPKTECYSTLLTTEVEAKSVDVYKSAIYPITLRNMGLFSESYNLSIQAPAWIYLSPTKVELGLNESKEIYLYAAPTYGVEKGNYTIIVYANSSLSTAQLELVTEIVSGNITQSQNISSVTMNISIPTGFVTVATEYLSSWKIVIISIMALAVVIILITRFMVLIK